MPEPELKVIGYPNFEKEFVGAVGTFTTFHGVVIGSAKITARWKTPRSWVSSHWHQIEVTLTDGGHSYTGRGAGSGMSYVGKLKKGK